MAAAIGRILHTRHGTESLPSEVSGRLAAAAEVKSGWLLGRNADGFVVPFTATTGLKSFGIASQDQRNDGADGDAMITAYSQVVDLVQSAAAGDSFGDADAPAVAYGQDNQTIGKLSAGRSAAGVFVGINHDTGKAMVWVGPIAAAVAAALSTP